MELAVRYQWHEVLLYDHSSRQMQANYGVPWVFESYHPHTVKFHPLGSPGHGGSNFPKQGGKLDSGRRNRSPTASFNIPADMATYTSDGRVICRSFNPIAYGIFSFFQLRGGGFLARTPEDTVRTV